MPNYGHLSLSCTKIERPSPLEKLSCKVRLFAQNRSRIYRQKVTVTTLSPTTSHPVFQLLAQMAHVCLHSRKRVHTRPSEKDRTQRLTRRNRGCFGWGWYHYPRSVPHVHKHPQAGCQNGKLCPFGSWSEALLKNAESLRDSDALMRVAVPRRRGPAGLRDLFCICRNCGLYALRPGPFRVYETVVVSLPSACSSCC